MAGIRFFGFHESSNWTQTRVAIYREGDRIVLEPVRRRPSLAQVLASLEPLDEDFASIDEPPTTPERF